MEVEQKEPKQKDWVRGEKSGDSCQTGTYHIMTEEKQTDSYTGTELPSTPCVSFSQVVPLMFPCLSYPLLASF